MITEKNYTEQVARLEAAIGQQLYSGSYKVWKDELEDNGISDGELKKAITMIMDGLADKSIGIRDIHLGTMIRYCNRAKNRLYQEKTQEQMDATKEQAKGFFQGKVKNISSYGRKCIELWRKLYDNTITLEEFKKQANLDAKENKVLRIPFKMP